MGMPKQKMIDLLYELMKNSRRSDRQLAKAVGVSQPTITRMRKTLEKKGYIYGYTLVPALDKIGFEIMAFNFLSADITEDFVKKIREWTVKSRKVIFSSLGGGLNGKTMVITSIHRDFTDFSTFIQSLESSFRSEIKSVDSFLCSLKTDVIQHLSYTDLEKP